MAVLMGERHAQTVIARALLPQFAGDFDGRLATDLEDGYAEAVVDLIGEVRSYVQLGGVALYQHS